MYDKVRDRYYSHGIQELSDGVTPDEFTMDDKTLYQSRFLPNHSFGCWTRLDGPVLEMIREFFEFIPAEYQNDVTWVVKDASNRKPTEGFEDEHENEKALGPTIGWKYRREDDRIARQEAAERKSKEGSEAVELLKQLRVGTG